jgi:NAD(H)-dependent 7beta-hydroxy-3-oxo-delta4-cholenoic acid oxidoreductase
MTGPKMLFSPVSIGTMALKNRVVMAPMATDYAEGEGLVSDRLLAYYEARARGGVGLITLEVCSIDAHFPYVPRNLGLWDDSLIPGLSRLTEAAHRHGAKIIPQLAHPGPESLSPIFTGEETVGPSAGIRNGITRLKCRELAVEEIAAIVEQFGQAALRARKAGFDGIELHAAHAYMLVGSFLSALKNRRTDTYGGSLEGRLRFCVEVIESIKTTAGADFPLVLRISGDELAPGGRGLNETRYMVSLLSHAGVDAFHVSAGVYPDRSWRVIPPAGTQPGVNAPLARAIRESTDLPVMVVGRITTPGLAEHILRRGDADLVVLGRALLADPDFVNKAMEGRSDDITPCIGCGMGCVANREQGGDMTCLANPGAGREGEDISPATRKKRIMVAGAGPAGLEFARMAALRGHDVTVFEKEHRAGGQLNLAALAPRKGEITGLIAHQERQARHAGASLVTGIEVTPELAAREKPDAIIIATGARTCTPGLCACEGAQFLCARDVLAGAIDIDGGRVLVIGGGMVGCEAAEYLATPLDSVSGPRTHVAIVEMSHTLAADMFSESRHYLFRSLRQRGVELYTGSTVVELLHDGALIEGAAGRLELRGFDHIINATGAEPVTELAAALADYSGELHVIGDAHEPRQALQAIAEGWDLGRTI